MKPNIIFCIYLASVDLGLRARLGGVNYLTPGLSRSLLIVYQQAQNCTFPPFKTDESFFLSAALSTVSADCWPAAYSLPPNRETLQLSGRRRSNLECLSSLIGRKCKLVMQTRLENTNICTEKAFNTSEKGFVTVFAPSKSLHLHWAPALAQRDA